MLKVGSSGSSGDREVGSSDEGEEHDQAEEGQGEKSVHAERGDEEDKADNNHGDVVEPLGRVIGGSGEPSHSRERSTNVMDRILSVCQTAPVAAIDDKDGAREC